ncbi:hypothetical protein DICPUDRAFT_53518 [Dictyostelium purpureum]|uniref:Uncharacterized protein n=1 Tax=Dictyostelium purpureum TaxID=5786 RepID=F0ZDA4_DICPU|nr:uncharacterized protein DICPUDRAFT_53518 [Dictyostelium purpureum]EGC38073.1 hypothetical protein DICPUDRAFT_53518 [Dictyostelium purpureum]|eukprot:XP_003285380.1 hypothetical protein DICPUDRAFT_53518 [Dictyostelium purpureum]
MAPKIDAAVFPLLVIVGTAVGFTVGVGYKRLSTDQDISLTRKGQMLWASRESPKFVDRNTTLDMYKEIHTGSFLKE